MASLNKVEFIGNLGRDPVMRYTPVGKQVTDFSMAMNEKWTGADGVEHEDTLWVKVTCWGKLAEISNEYLKKGRQVYVEGKLKGDAKGNPTIWNGIDGSPHASFEVTASKVLFLGSKTDAPTSTPAETVADDEMDIPF